MTNLTHRVYYFYDADDWCLYIGMTSDLQGRMRTHEQSKAMRCATRIEWTELMTRERAVALEAAEIRVHGPAFNVTHNLARYVAVHEWFAEMNDALRAAPGRPKRLDFFLEYIETHPQPHQVERRSEMAA